MPRLVVKAVRPDLLLEHVRAHAAERSAGHASLLALLRQPPIARDEAAIEAQLLPLLRGNRIFSRASDAERLMAARQVELRVYEEGQAVCVAGAVGECFRVLWGVARTTKWDARRGKPRYLDAVEEGEMLFEVRGSMGSAGVWVGCACVRGRGGGGVLHVCAAVRNGCVAPAHSRSSCAGSPRLWAWRRGTGCTCSC